MTWCVVRSAEGALVLLHSAAELLNGPLVLGYVLLVLHLKRGYEVLHDELVKTLGAQLCVTVRRRDLEHTVVECEQADVESATTQLVDQDVLPGLLIHAVGERRCSRLADGPEDNQASAGASSLGGSPVLILEVCRHRGDNMLHLFAQAFRYPGLRYA